MLLCKKTKIRVGIGIVRQADIHFVYKTLSHSAEQNNYA